MYAATGLTITEAALAMAALQLDGRPDGGGVSRQQKIEIYLATVGRLPGEPWDAAAMYYCFRLAGAILKTTNPFPRTGSAPHVWSLADRHFRVLAPYRGCVYVVDRGGGRGHTGIVEGVTDAGVISELSGDVEGQEGQEGTRWARRYWNWRTGQAHDGRLAGFLDFALAAPGSALGAEARA